jgi:hypothetical protein
MDINGIRNCLENMNKELTELDKKHKHNNYSYYQASASEIIETIQHFDQAVMLMELANDNPEPDLKVIQQNIQPSH